MNKRAVTLIALLLAAAHVSLAARYAVHDIARPLSWRIHRHIADARATSLAEIAKKERVPRGRPPRHPISRGYLLLASPWHHFVPPQIPKQSRYAIALRLVAGVAYAACLVVSFLALAALFPIGPALAAWLVALAAMASHAEAGFLAYADSLALLLGWLAMRAFAGMRTTHPARRGLLGFALFAFGATLDPDVRLLVPLLCAPAVGWALTVSAGVLAWKRAVTALLTAASIAAFLYGQRTYARSVAMLENEVVEARRATADELVATWRHEIGLVSTEKLWATWRVPLPKELAAGYFRPAETGFDVTHVGDPKLERVRALRMKWIAADSDLRELPDLMCLRRVREIIPEIPVGDPSNSISAWISFRHTWRELYGRPVTSNSVGGPKLWLFDAGPCLTPAKERGRQ